MSITDREAFKNQLFLTEFNAKAIIHEQDQTDSRRVKRDLIKEGYDKQTSLYYALTDQETGTSRRVRIEILSDKLLEQKALLYILNFFQNVLTKAAYSIWIYDSHRMALSLEKEYAYHVA